MKGIKEEPNKSHVFLRQDPITKLWGVVYANKGASDRVFYFSPNVSRNQEAERVRQWLKDQGATQYLNDWVPSPSYSDKYKNTDQQFSLIWSLGFLGITAREWNKTPEGSMNWEDFNDESKWRPVGEVELEKYGN